MIATPNQVAWWRMQRSGLVDPFASVAGACQALGGIQAQVLRSAGLGLSARLTRPFTTGDLANELYARRRVVKIWSHRRTLHLHDRDDWPLVFSLVQDRTTWAEAAVRRVDGDLDALRAAVKGVAELLRNGGTVSRKIMLERRPDLEPFLNLGIGLFMDVQQSGPVCHAQPVGSESHFAHKDEWIPDLVWSPPDRNEAGVAMVQRYLRAYGPATPQDVAFWLGSSVKDVRRWLGLLDDAPTSVRVDGVEHWATEEVCRELAATPPQRSAWPVRLLHRYDVLLLSHKDKSWLIDPKYYKRVWKKAGVVDAVVLSGGRIVGTWSYKLKTRTVDITVVPFGRLTATARRAIQREARRVAEHLEVGLGALLYEG